MDRVDSKFIFPSDQLLNILSAIENKYSVLEIAGKRIFDYTNFYYDTSDFHLFHSHHNGKLNRFKVRYRHYVDSDTRFLEVKFKNNKKRTIKNRIPVENSPGQVITDSSHFLNQCGLEYDLRSRPVQQGQYQRIALANEAAGERLTIDLDLSFKKPGHGTKKNLGNYVVAELKQSQLNRKSPFYQLMRKMGIRPGSFSKYCMGMVMLGGDNLKTNKFKATTLRVKKINNTFTKSMA